MEQKTFITDCENVKLEAIKGVLSEHFKDFFPIHPIVNKSKSFTTPLTFEDFFLTTEKRVQFLVSITPGPRWGIPVYATLQKGYYRRGLDWYLTCCAGYSEGVGKKTFLVPGSSILLKENISEAKNKNLESNISDIISELYPEWNKKMSVYTFFTGEDEKDWLQQPLRHLLKTVKL